MATIEFSLDMQIPVDAGEVAFVDLVSDGLERPLLQHWLPGRWNTSRESNLRRVLRACARMLARPRVFADIATRQLDPATAEAELARWETLLRLDTKGALELRRSAARARLRARGGQSAAYFVELLEGLGYQEVEVRGAYEPARCGDRLGVRVQGEAWAFTLYIKAQSQGALDGEIEALVREGVRAGVFAVVFRWV